VEAGVTIVPQCEIRRSAQEFLRFGGNSLFPGAAAAVAGLLPARFVTRAEKISVVFSER
jgi:hypothetical protein